MNAHHLALLLAFLPELLGLAGEPKRIYLANDDHTDFMWTADEETYERVFVEMLDFHLQLADATSTNAPPYRNRFNADGSWWLAAYERTKTPAEFARLIARVQDGTIGAPLNTLVSCYGAQPVEAVLRGLYYAGRLERRHGVRFPLAVAMENQTLPLGLASLFAGSGARYSWRGVCGCASRFDNHVLGRRDREIYWWTGKDGRRLLLKWHSLAPAGNRLSGGYAEAFDPVQAIRFLDSDVGFLSRYRPPGAADPYRVLGAFGFGWDALDRKTGQPYAADPVAYPPCDHFHEIARRETTAQRQVIVSNETDFFEDFERTHGRSVEAQSVTFGNEWDLYSASMSETSARVKRSVEKLRAAELLAAYVSRHDPGLLTRHNPARDRAFHALGLYWEHNWTADGPIPRARRAAWQEKLAGQVESYVNTLHEEAADRFGGLIRTMAGKPRFYVLNPLGWERTDVAEVAYEGSDDIHVHDLAAGRDVPCQKIEAGGASHLRVLADTVPPAGYKVFEIRPGPGDAAREPAASAARGVLENEAVRLVLERDGAIRSLVDKRRGGVELAAESDGLKLNDFAAGTEEGEPIEVVERGPVSVTVRARTPANPPRTTLVTLYRASDRVDVANEIHGNFGDTRSWSFSFAFRDPSVRTEEVGAINLNKLRRDGGDYADTHARYDHVTVNHFADISDGSGRKGVTLSNPDLAFARLGRSTVSTLDTATPQIHFLAGGQVDGPALGIPAQNGNQRFLQRFALRPHGGYSAVAAMKFALEHQNPLVTGRVTGSQPAYPAKAHSLLTLSHSNVLLWALKPHDDGIEAGLVARVWNLSDQPATTRFRGVKPFSGVRRLTHVETPIEDLPVTDGVFETVIGPQRMETFGW